MIIMQEINFRWKYLSFKAARDQKEMEQKLDAEERIEEMEVSSMKMNLNQSMNSELLRYHFRC